MELPELYTVHGVRAVCVCAVITAFQLPVIEHFTKELIGLSSHLTLACSLLVNTNELK